MRTTENERRDGVVIAFILFFGLLWILVAGGWALRFTPHWELDTNVYSRIDPNSDFLTNKPDGFIEPVDPAILTNPAWINDFLTPGAASSTAKQLSTTSDAPNTTSTAGTPVTTQTTVLTTTALATSTAPALTSPTNTLVYVPPPLTSTSKPKPGSTSTPTPAPTVTVTSTLAFASTPTNTATSTLALTFTSTNTATSTSIVTNTNTPDPIEPDFGGPDGNAIVLGNGSWIEFNLSGFLLDGNAAWDVVYYEKEETSAAGKVHLGRVRIEVYDETTATWYTIYHWGDGAADANASYNNGNSEPDGFPVDMSLLSGVPPLNTGIAIDIDSVAIAQGGTNGDSITKIRITSLSNLDCDIDALLMLR